MSSTLSPSDVFELLMIGTGFLLLLKRLADIDKQYERRLWVITFIMTLAVVILFIARGLSLADSPNVDCPKDHYCQTEMVSF